MSTATAITMHPVTSSQISAIGHRPATETLAIQFPPKKSGVADTYHYQGVSAGMFAEFLAAESQGSFFIQRIKKYPEQFPYQKIEAAAPVAVGAVLIGAGQDVGAPAAPVADAVALIGPVPVARDAEGWWSHPGIPLFDEGQEDEYKAWLATQCLVTTYASLSDEKDTHPAHIEYYERSGTDVSGWAPLEPVGDGWFTISVHDTEDGPYWVWARRVDVAADHAEALKINVCYSEQLGEGQHYSRVTFKDTGYPILLDADGKRSVFCDLCDDMEDAA